MRTSTLAVFSFIAAALCVSTALRCFGDLVTGVGSPYLNVAFIVILLGCAVLDVKIFLRSLGVME